MYSLVICNFSGFDAEENQKKSAAQALSRQRKDTARIDDFFYQGCGNEGQQNGIGRAMKISAKHTLRFNFLRLSANSRENALFVLTSVENCALF